MIKDPPYQFEDSEVIEMMMKMKTQFEGRTDVL